MSFEAVVWHTVCSASTELKQISSHEVSIIGDNRKCVGYLYDVVICYSLNQRTPFRKTSKILVWFCLHNNSKMCMF